MTLPFHPLTANYMIIPSHLEPQTTQCPTLLSSFTFGRSRENTISKATCVKKAFSFVCNMVTSIHMAYAYHSLTCIYVILLLLCSIKQWKHKTCTFVFGASTKDTILENGTCIKMSFITFCNRTTSNLISLPCHPMTGEQQILLSYLEL